MKYNKVYDIQHPPIKECPYCGCKELYFTEQYRGVSVINIDLDDDVIKPDFSEMYNDAEIVRRSKYTYCAGCKKRLFRIE